METVSIDQEDSEAARVGRIAALPAILDALREIAGLDYAAVARVEGGRWTPCASSGSLGAGPIVGAPIPAEETFCHEALRARAPLLIDDASRDPVFKNHPAIGRLGALSYAGAPIVLENGALFGALCAMGRGPAEVSDRRAAAVLVHFARQIASEIDHQRKAEASLRELLDERADGASRERFMAILGHDLRNPLSSILACANIVRIKSQDAVMTNLADRIGDNVRRMATLITDLLDLARGQRYDGIPIAIAPIEGLGQAIESVVDELRAANPGRELRLRLDIDRPVAGDKSRLQQLVSNLAANALAHGAAGAPVEIAASTRAGRLAIEVANQGAPIPAETLPGIFGAYARREPANGEARDGLGLGLYICERIARAHGGELSVQSTREGGTRFAAIIPLLETAGAGLGDLAPAGDLASA